MSLFGSLMGDVEEDPFFGSHMRHMNTMMNSLFSDPFGMLGGGGPLAIAGPRHGASLMPFMPQMPSMNRLFAGVNYPTANMDHGHMSAGSSFTSSTVVMSSGPNGKPQVYSSSSSTKIGPNGIKETRKTLQDSRTGTKKMSIGHHIGERAHVIEREQNVYSGDAEERQEFINIDEEEAEDFDREFQTKVGAPSRAPRLALPAPPRAHVHSPHATHALAIAAPPHLAPNTSSEGSSRRASNYRPAARRPLRATASPLVVPASTRVREVYSAPHPQRHRHRHHKPRHDQHQQQQHHHHQQHSPGH